MAAFTAKRAGYLQTIILDDVPERIFPLFTPEEEKKWAAGWDFELIYGSSDQVEENLIFTTAAHDHGQSGALWIISRYEPPTYFIEYQRLEPGLKAGRIRIKCQAGEGGKTLATIEYVYTALSEKGNEFIEHFSADEYVSFIGHWEEAINYYLKTGRVLR
ncbi:MAG TPA: hypothetical protein PKE64_27205 [Anaerolineae bacterium]|nr:hypothetical protein [Anaerolineae bacterium]HMR67715.1 hypothetical protein [Anaerolineae bacterium]